MVVISDVTLWLAVGGIAATLGVLLFTSYPKAHVLAMSAIVLFALQMGECWGAQTRCLGLEPLALSASKAQAGEVWGLATYAFLHSGLFHLFGNLFILLTAGPALEDSVGEGWFLGIYGLGALAAAASGVGLAFWTDIVHVQTLMVGSSGAIFAILTAFAVRHPMEKLPTILVFFVVWLPSMWVLLLFLLLNIAYVFTETNIAWYGHFAGFLVGLAVATRLGPIEEEHEDAPLSVESLRPLAETPRAREAVEHLAHLQAGELDVAGAWLDVLAEEAGCPVCGKALEHRGMKLVCEEGHVVRPGIGQR